MAGPWEAYRSSGEGPWSAYKAKSPTLAEETGDFESAVIGAGYMTDRLLKGGKQMVLQAVAALPGADMISAPAKAELSRMAEAEALDSALYKQLQDAHPKSTLAGEIFAQLPFGMVGKGYQAAMAAGALPGLLEYGTTEEKLTRGALGSAGGAAGQALGNLVGRLIFKRSGDVLTNIERDELVKAAQEAGYKLTPGEITGKTWQKTLDAVLKQNPATAKRMQERAMQNQATTERLVEGALERAGGSIDQLSAGAAAKAGLDSAKATEAAAVDSAYREVLDGLIVNLESTRPGMAAIRANQRKLPEANQGTEAVRALNELLGTGTPTVSNYFDHGAARAAEDPITRLTAAINRMVDEKSAPKAAKPGYIAENKEIPGGLAQDLRSDYGIKSEAAYANAKNQAGDVWREMRGTVDKAIEDALPSGDKQKFAQINERYGMGAGLRTLKTDDQQLILAKIYRGFDSPDAFANFIALAPDNEFREVARGFLTKIVDSARDGNKAISAERIGREVRKVDKASPDGPSALQILGQESGDTLRLVGRIGETLLPDIPNSGTAQRAMMQSLISGGGALAGAGYGGSEGGGTGALAGTLAGAFLAPKVAQRIYMSDLARGFLTRAPAEYAGIPGLRDMSPETAKLLINLLRGGGTGVVASAGN